MLMAEPCKHSRFSPFQPLSALQRQAVSHRWREVRRWQPSWQHSQPPGPLIELSWHGAGGCGAAGLGRHPVSPHDDHTDSKKASLAGLSWPCSAPRTTFLACTSLQTNCSPTSRSSEEEDKVSSQASHHLQHGLIKITWISLFALSHWERINVLE